MGWTITRFLRKGNLHLTDYHGVLLASRASELANMTHAVQIATDCTMVQVVILPQSADEARTLKTTALAPGGSATGDTVAKMLRKKKAAELIGTWKFKSGGGSGTLQLWGWRDGKAGTENKQELPPPHDEVLLFGDAVVVLVTATGAQDFTAEKWAVFYEEAFGGFEDLGDKEADDEDAEEDAEEDDEEADGDAEEEDEEEEDEDEEAEEADEEAEEAEEEEAEEEDGDCYEEGDEGGGGKRRSARRRTATDNEYRRVEMGLRARVKLPVTPSKRAPRWQTAPELEAEEY